MPARGGLDDAMFDEIRNAVAYMFNPASATMIAAVAVPDPTPDALRKVIGDIEIFIGIASAQSIRSEQKIRAQSAISPVPLRANQHHINLTLRGETKSLDIIAINKGISYSGFFALPTRGRYAITVKIRRPDATQTIEAKFSYTRE